MGECGQCAGLIGIADGAHGDTHDDVRDEKM
jgi:hypothetical protein